MGEKCTGSAVWGFDVDRGSQVGEEGCVRVPRAPA